MVSSTERQRDILRVLAEEPSTAAELATRIHVSVRQAQRDLAELRARFPSQLREEPDGDARSHRWYLDGLPPEPLAKPLTYLSHDELTAIIAARGLLRHPDARHPGWESQRSAYDGDLSAALHGLLERSGLADEAAAIAPRTLGASRFAVATDPPGAVATIGRALRTGQAVRFRYRNRRGGESDVHVVPMRLVAIRGEYHCFSWASEAKKPPGRVKQYRLSRIIPVAGTVVTVVRQRPPGCPVMLPHGDVDAMLATGFNATSSAHSDETMRISVAIGPDAWPDVVDRTWGDAQTVEAAPEHGPDWHRLTFRTSGWLEARGWILSLAAQARVEAPEMLRTWLREQIEQMRSDLTPECDQTRSRMSDITSHHA